MAGQVRSGSERIDKPSRLLREDSDLSILRPLKFVGRGGLKMENFLLESNFDVKKIFIFWILGLQLEASQIAYSKKVPL